MAPVSLARDQRGAVMVMGVFMACFLCGCLWFLIGMTPFTPVRN